MDYGQGDVANLVNGIFSSVGELEISLKPVFGHIFPLQRIRQMINEKALRLFHGVSLHIDFSMAASLCIGFKQIPVLIIILLYVGIKFYPSGSTNSLSRTESVFLYLEVS